MGLFFGKEQRSDFLPQQAQSQHTPSFLEEVSAAYRSFSALNLSFSEESLVYDQWSPIVDVINERMPSETPLKNPVIANQFSSYVGRQLAGRGGDDFNESTLYYMNVQNVLNKIFENPDVFPEYQDLTHEQILEQAKKEALDAQAEYQEIQSRTSGTQSFFAGLIGGGGAVVKDPVVVLPALVTGAYSGGKSLWHLAFREASVSAGSEILVQKEVSEWYDSLGLEYTPEQFWTAVSTAGIAGGALPPAIVIGGKTIRLTAEQAKQGYEVIKNSGLLKRNKVTDSIDNAAESVDDAIKSNPLEDLDEHVSKLQEAETNFANMDGTPFTGAPSSRVVRPSSVYDADNTQGVVQSFDPNEIEVDPSLFKLEREPSPSDTLMAEEPWSDVKSGQVVVYEYADGRKVILDGEKRLARAKAEGKKLNGQVIREVDGFTPEMARVVRETIDSTGDSAIRIQTNALLNLGDDGFMAMAKGIIPTRYAAIIGDLIPDDEILQNTAIAAVSKANPENGIQAEAIVRQVIGDGADATKQADLFSSDIVSEALYAERAKVLDMAIKALKNDKKSFKQLLEGRGDDLAKTYSKSKVEADAKAISYVQTLANQSGELSTALNDAARLAKESGNYRTPARGFTDAVRRSIESGDFNRLEASNVRQSVYVTTQKRPNPNVAEVALRQFDDPASDSVSKVTDQLEEDLFGEVQLTDEMLDAPADVRRIDPETGEFEFQTVREALQEIEDDAAIMSRIGECVR